MSDLRTHPVSRAFTMIELVVVIILIGVLGMVIAPRILDTGSRSVEIEARAVRTLLSAAAQRDALSNQSLAIVYDPEERSLTMFIQRESQSDTAGQVAQWEAAVLVQPVHIASSNIAGVAVDGQMMPAERTGSWR